MKTLHDVVREIRAARIATPTEAALAAKSAECVRLRALLQTMIDLHWDWAPGGRATAKFVKRNDEAVRAARLELSVQS